MALFAMTSPTKTEPESEFGTSRTKKGRRCVDKSPSEVETTRKSGRLRGKETISQKGASIVDRKWKGVEDDAKKSRSRAVRNRSIARFAKNGASRAFSARFDDRKRFAASNDRSRNFERIETKPEPPEKRRFSKGAPTRSDAVRTSALVRKSGLEAGEARRLDAKEREANKDGRGHLGQDGALGFSELTS